MTKYSDRFVVIFVGVIAIAHQTICFCAEEPTTRVDLTGQVKDADEQPIRGATVMVWTAGVKQGYSTYCPSCYADCGKRADTNSQGGFEVSRLNGDLRFRLLIVKEGYAPTFVDKVDPVDGPVKATLPAYIQPADPLQVVKGRVVDVRGQPISGAVVDPEVVHYRVDKGQLLGSGGAVKGLDPLAVSNDAGEFSLAFHKPAESMTLLVKARGMVAKRLEKLSTGEKQHVITLNSGATVRGRLLNKGQPIAGAEMGLVSKERAMGEYYREERIGTKRDGTFEFSNVPIGVTWYVYAKMDSIVQYGATQPIECKTKKDDETVDVGKIEIKPGHRLSGRVILTDGQPIPDGMRMFVSTNRAWDSQSEILPADGKFEFLNLPSDNYSINAAIKGYRPSEKNPNLGWSIEGLIDRDIKDFVILMEPGNLNFAGRFGGKFRDKKLQSVPDK